MFSGTEATTTGDRGTSGMEKGWTRKEEHVDSGPCPEGLETDTAAVMTADVLGTHAKGWTQFQALFSVEIGRASCRERV